MASSNSPPLLLLFSFPILFLLVSGSSHHLPSHEISAREWRREGGVGRRMLMSFRENPGGGNVTFECSPSGPCVPCLYFEKNNEKYRCSETGYRIRLKCVEVEDNSKKANVKKSHNGRSTVEIPHDEVKPHVVLDDAEELIISTEHRRLLDDSTLEGGSWAYITYRSCIPAVTAEKLSVQGFEGIMLCLLLVSGSVVYFRRKRTIVMSGVGGLRIQPNSRF